MKNLPLFTLDHTDFNFLMKITGVSEALNNFCSSQPLKKICVIIYLLLFQSISFSQHDHNGIFIENDSVVATSKASYKKSDGYGKDIYTIKKLSNEEMLVTRQFIKTELPNPDYICYYYSMSTSNKGFITIDMKAALSPMALNYVWENVTYKYTGESILFPTSITKRTKLPDAKGEMEFITKENNQLFNKYQLSISHRSLIENGNVTLGGRIYKSYIHQYNLSQKILNAKGDVKIEILENVKEIFIPELGVVSQNRTGTYQNSTSKKTDAYIFESQFNELN